MHPQRAPIKMVQLDHTFVQHKKGLQGIKHGCREDKILYLTNPQRKTEEQKQLGEKKTPTIP